MREREPGRDTALSWPGVRSRPGDGHGEQGAEGAGRQRLLPVALRGVNNTWSSAPGSCGSARSGPQPGTSLLSYISFWRFVNGRSSVTFGVGRAAACRGAAAQRAQARNVPACPANRQFLGAKPWESPCAGKAHTAPGLPGAQVLCAGTGSTHTGCGKCNRAQQGQASCNATVQDEPEISLESRSPGTLMQARKRHRERLPNEFQQGALAIQEHNHFS